jgi:hypothetical protein
MLETFFYMDHNFFSWDFTCSYMWIRTRKISLLFSFRNVFLSKWRICTEIKSESPRFYVSLPSRRGCSRDRAREKCAPKDKMFQVGHGGATWRYKRTNVHPLFLRVFTVPLWGCWSRALSTSFHGPSFPHAAGRGMGIWLACFTSQPEPPFVAVADARVDSGMPWHLVQ